MLRRGQCGEALARPALVRAACAGRDTDIAGPLGKQPRRLGAPNLVERKPEVGARPYAVGDFDQIEELLDVVWLDAPPWPALEPPVPALLEDAATPA